jgi:hypothetical protein
MPNPGPGLARCTWAVAAQHGSEDRSDRYGSVPAECFRWRCTGGLALLHGVASDALVGSDPGVEYIYTAVDVAALQLIIYPWSHGPTAPPGSVALRLPGICNSITLLYHTGTTRFEGTFLA